MGDEQSSGMNPFTPPKRAGRIVAPSWKGRCVPSVEKTIQSLNIVVIDDNAFNRALAGETLKAIGAIRFQLARDLEAAAEIFKTVTPNLILCERDLTEQSGVAVARRIRNAEFAIARSTPVILLTSRSRTSDVEGARDAGINEYVVRPFAAQALRDRIAATILRPRPFVVSAGYVGPCRRRRAVVDYAGPKRRANDSAETETSGQSLTRSRAKATILAARKAARTVNAGKAARLKKIRARAVELLDIAFKAKDALLFSATDVLLGYLDMHGRKADYDMRVVDSCLAALDTVATATDQRERQAAIDAANRAVLSHAAAAGQGARRM